MIDIINTGDWDFSQAFLFYIKFIQFITHF